MRVLIPGAGAIGGYYGARLTGAGHDVAFQVRSARAALLAEHGLRVHSGQGDFSQPVQAITPLEARWRYDLVIVPCKASDLDSAITAITPAVGPRTLVLPLLNGLRQLDALDTAFGTVICCRRRRLPMPNVPAHASAGRRGATPAFFVGAAAAAMLFVPIAEEHRAAALLQGDSK